MAANENRLANRTPVVRDPFSRSLSRGRGEERTVRERRPPSRGRAAMTRSVLRVEANLSPFDADPRTRASGETLRAF